MAKHTPGKWRVDKTSMGRAGLVLSEDDLIIAECWNADQEANARLIASAPELLEACKDFIDDTNYIEDKDFPGDYINPNFILEYRDKIKQAIARVEGE